MRFICRLKETSVGGLGIKTNTITLNLGLDDISTPTDQESIHRANVRFLKLLFAVTPSIQVALFSNPARAAVISSYVATWENDRISTESEVEDSI